VAVQDQALGAKCFKGKILKEKLANKSGLCKEYEETIDHLTSGCPICKE
jgi:hypothetical protein